MSEDELKTSEAQRRASLKWERGNVDKITMKFRKDGRDGFTKDQVRAVAEACGFKSVNAWLVDLIRRNL